MTSIIDINSFTELFIQKNRNNKKPQFIPLKRKKKKKKNTLFI